MQESVFKQGHGVAAFNSAFGSNTTQPGFNSAFNQAFGPSTAPSTFGSTHVSHTSPFQRNSNTTAGTTSQSQRNFTNNAFDDAIGDSGGNTFNHTSPFGQPSQTFNQSQPHLNKGPFSKPRHQPNHTSAFQTGLFQTPKPSSPFGANHASPFNTPNPQASPFQPTTGPFGTTHASPFNTPTPNPQATPFKPAHVSPFNSSNSQPRPFQTPKDNPFLAPLANPFLTPKEEPYQPPKPNQFQTPNVNASPFNPQALKTNSKTSVFKTPQNGEHTSPFKTPSYQGNTPKTSAFKTSLLNNRTNDSSSSSFKSTKTTDDGVFKVPLPPNKASTTATRGKARLAIGKRGGRGGGLSPKGTTDPYSRNKSVKSISPPVKEVGKMTAEDRAMRFGSTSKSILYDQVSNYYVFLYLNYSKPSFFKFKERRVRERQQAIEQGLIPDPENPTRLEDAIDFRGTCETKCPPFEMLEREIQNGLDSLEMDETGQLDPTRAVKAYRRSAAGIDQPLPSDVRSPEALLVCITLIIYAFIHSPFSFD